MSDDELERWMENLPLSQRLLPLISLCIPGSHDTFSCDLNVTGPVSNDQPHWLKTICRWAPPIKHIVYNWGRCQQISIGDQLHAGVRYFDIRLSRQENGIFTVHGLCGPSLDQLLEEIGDFLSTQTREIIILDFNHFYNMDVDQHRDCVQRILASIGLSRCCPSPPSIDIQQLNLEDMLQNGYRAIVIYQAGDLLPHITDSRSINRCWTGRYIRSPWPNTNRLPKLIDRIESDLSMKHRLLPDGGFFVSQGVLTPRVSDILVAPLSTLRKRMAEPATDSVICWLQNDGRRWRSRLNIVMVDFVEIHQFCQSVISLNFVSWSKEASLH